MIIIIILRPLPNQWDELKRKTFLSRSFYVASFPIDLVENVTDSSEVDWRHGSL